MAEKVTALKNAIFIATGFETAREQIHFWNFSFGESQKAMTGKRKIKKGLKWLKSWKVMEKLILEKMKIVMLEV